MWRVYNLRHTTVFTYSHANSPLSQSERAYYLSYFINMVKSWDKTTFTGLHFENPDRHVNALKSAADSRMVKS